MTTRDDFGLTHRQREVLQLVADGYTHRDIAAALGLQIKTIDSHVSTICGVLRARNGTHAAVEGVRKEVID